jgi:hypothetical protein
VACVTCLPDIGLSSANIAAASQWQQQEQHPAAAAAYSSQS